MKIKIIVCTVEYNNLDKFEKMVEDEIEKGFTLKGLESEMYKTGDAIFGYQNKLLYKAWFIKSNFRCLIEKIFRKRKK